jgi:2-keto-4-pentenoate hydratase
VKLLAQQNLSLPTGSIVLAGAATAAIELKYGQKITATLETIGAVEFTVV